MHSVRPWNERFACDQIFRCFHSQVWRALIVSDVLCSWNGNRLGHLRSACGIGPSGFLRILELCVLWVEIREFWKNQ